MELSNFARKMTSQSGILQAMDDMGKALANGNVRAMFGGGNPAEIPEVTAAFKQSLQEILNDEKRAAAMLGNYDPPGGNVQFVAAMKDFLNRHYNLGVTEENIAVTPGSQSGNFMLFNLLAGKHGQQQKKIVFPLVPEYIGYVDQALEPESFVGVRPEIEKIGAHDFKYKIDFEALEKIKNVAAICLSRPTNPSGNVVTNHELQRLGTIAEKLDVPLIIDSAYGLPFPGVMNDESELFWHGHTVISMTLSKVGLPGSRVGIFVGPEKLIRTLKNTNTIMNLASPGFGQCVATPLLENDKLLDLSKQHIKPYYYGRAKKARALMDEHFPADLPWRLHEHEGSYFFWLWCEGAKLQSLGMYEELKKHGVVVVPGDYFFPGIDTADWPHAQECLRLNIARPDEELQDGIRILSEVLKKAW